MSETVVIFGKKAFDAPPTAACQSPPSVKITLHTPANHKIDTEQVMAKQCIH